MSLFPWAARIPHVAYRNGIVAVYDERNRRR